MADRSSSVTDAVDASRGMQPGADNYRAYVGPPQQYDFMGATQFRLASSLGLRESDSFLDIGCGSLRAGKLLIQYLLPEKYHGLEPNAWLIEQARETEIGHDAFEIKKPRFAHNAVFDATGFGTDFDMIIAQSIFSHTAEAMFRDALSKIAPLVKPRGQFLFTVLSETSPSYRKTAKGRDREGWIYPGCVTFPARDVERFCSEVGLHAQRLEWFHPRQVWFRAVRDPALKLGWRARRRLGRGAVLFDDRFDCL